MSSNKSVILVEAVVYYVSSCYVMGSDWPTLENWAEWLRKVRAQESQLQQVCWHFHTKLKQS